MPDPTFILDVETDPAVGIVRLCLTDEEGLQLGANQVCLAEHSPALWQGLFDTRAYVQTYAGGMRFTGRPATAENLLEQIGVFLGTTVLGSVITKALAAGIHHRTLVVRQPQAPSDRLAAAFARVPWEIARSVTGADALFKKNLVVRMETPGAEPAYGFSRPVPAGPLRVLLVFAEAGSSPPLAMRLEREQLLRLFYDEVMPRRQVEVDVLCHGVTRRILREKVRKASGYYVVHWSGHGAHNLLELMGEDGKPDHLTGADLIGLFTEAGGFIPQLVFLSACLSGTLVRDRAALTAALRGEVGPSKAEPERPEDTERLIAEQPGYTGTAMALLGAGVPQVVAMRYEIGDAYARDLAGLFYKRLLADDNPKAAASALSIARSELLNRDAPEHDPVDHATPLLLGRDIGPLPAPSGRSAALRLCWPQPQPQPLLTDNHKLDRPAELVGRGEPLSRLRGCLEGGRPAVALVQGLAGLGKTALVAEAVHLWHHHFDGVFAFQAKPLKLGLDDFMCRLDERLILYSEVYRVLCKERPNAAVYLPPSNALNGDTRWRQMRANLLEVLRNERLLLVIDNFETNLESVSGPDGYACTDPEWDRLLQYLAAELSGSGSRLLLTSRHRLAVLASPERALWLLLGPLPMAEAVLFVQGSEVLRRLAYSDKEGHQLVFRLLEVSRGHPLILTLLETLASNRKELARALDVLATKGLDRLADVFTPHLSAAERGWELAYLEEVAVGAVDLLIRRASRKARWLLWLVALASDPVTERMIQGVCSGKSLEEELREGGDLPSVRPLLLDLRAAGLLTVNEGGDGTYELYSFHEVVREGVTAWMAIHPGEKAGWAAEKVWVAYGERYATLAESVLQRGVEGWWEHAMEASRRGLAYFARARAFDRLSPVASRIVTSTQDLRILRGVVAVLGEVSGEVPAGKARWNLKTNLADAWRQAGHPDIALPYYEEALEEAEAAEHWPDVEWIRPNLALALNEVGRLSEAKSIYQQIADAGSKSGSPRVDILAREFETLRIEIMQHRAKQALPQLAGRLQEARALWRQQRQGELPEAQDAVFLARVLLAGLDVALDANISLERWSTCLTLLAESEEVMRASGEGEAEFAGTRFKCYGPLIRLGRLDEAQRILERCLNFWRRAGDLPHQANALSALADLWKQRGDQRKAVGLEQQALASHNRCSDLVARSKSHGNLASYLDSIGSAEEAAGHLLAAICYDLVTSHSQCLSIHAGNLAILMRRAESAGARFDLPRLAKVLGRPDFEPFRRMLTVQPVAADDLQAGVDVLVEQIRQGGGRLPK